MASELIPDPGDQLTQSAVRSYEPSTRTHLRVVADDSVEETIDLGLGVDDPSPVRFDDGDRTVDMPAAESNSETTSQFAREFKGRFWDEINQMSLPDGVVYLLRNFASNYLDLGFQTETSRGRNQTPDGSIAEQIAWIAAQDLARQMRLYDASEVPDFSSDVPSLSERRSARFGRNSFRGVLKDMFRGGVRGMVPHRRSKAVDRAQDEMSTPIDNTAHLEQQSSIAAAISEFTSDTDGPDLSTLFSQESSRELLATGIANKLGNIELLEQVGRGILHAMDQIEDLSKANPNREAQLGRCIAEVLQAKDAFEMVGPVLKKAILKSGLDVGVLTGQQYGAIAQIMAQRSLYNAVRDLGLVDLMDPTYEALETVVRTNHGPRNMTLKIGEGGMGAVYLTEKGGEVGVLKVLLPHVGGGSTTTPAHSLAREGKVLDRINHPNVVRVLERGTIDGGMPYIVMEYLPGPSLNKVLTRGKATSADVGKLIWQMSLGLDAAHNSGEGLVHRDVKPSNTVLGPDGVKILDFGLVRNLDDTESLDRSMTQEGQVKGTVHFMSPEQASGMTDKDSVTTKIDVWGLGATTYAMLSRRPPFVADEESGEGITDVLRRIRLDDPDLSLIPESYRDLVGQMLSKNPKGRPELYQARQQLALILAKESGLQCIDPAQIADLDLADLASAHGVRVQVEQDTLADRDRVVADLRELNIDGDLFFDPGVITTAEYDRMTDGKGAFEGGPMADYERYFTHAKKQRARGESASVTAEENYEGFIRTAGRDGIPAGRVRRMQSDRRAELIRDTVGFGGIAATIGAPITTVAVEDYLKSRAPTVVVKTEIKTEQVDAFGRKVSAAEARLAFKNPDILDDNPAMGLKLSAEAEGMSGNVLFRRIRIDPEQSLALAKKFGVVLERDGGLPGYQFKGPYGEVMCIPSIGTVYRSDMGVLTRIPNGGFGTDEKIPASLVKLIGILPDSHKWNVNSVGEGVTVPPKMQEHLLRKEGIDASTPEGLEQAKEHFARTGVRAGILTIKRAIGLTPVPTPSTVKRPAVPNVIPAVREAINRLRPGQKPIKSAAIPGEDTFVSQQVPANDDEQVRSIEEENKEGAE